MRCKYVPIRPSPMANVNNRCSTEKSIKISSRKSYRNWLHDIVKNAHSSGPVTHTHARIFRQYVPRNLRHLLRLHTKVTTNRVGDKAHICSCEHWTRAILSVVSLNLPIFFPPSIGPSGSRASIKMSIFSNTNLLCMFIMSASICRIVSNVAKCSKWTRRDNLRWQRIIFIVLSMV